MDNWQKEAACRGIDPELFYPDTGESTKEAQNVCITCPVRQQCFEYAITTKQRFGIWAGTSEKQRRSIRRKHFLKGYTLESLYLELL